jgi:hypothetical protein
MTVVDLTFVCDRLSEHPDDKPRSWSAQGQERVMDSRSQALTPVVIAPDAACPDCGEIGAADYPTGTVFVIPDDPSFALQVEQIRDDIAGTP